MDTGTSLLAGPSDVVEGLGTKLNLKEDCSNFHQLPLLGFALGDKVLNLMPDDYIDRATGTCSLSLMTLDVPPPKGPLFIFGDPFLRRFLTVYDRDGPRVGFAVAKHKGSEQLASKLIATMPGAPGSGSAEVSSSHPAELPTPAPASEEPKWSPTSDLDKLDSYNRALASPTDSPAAPAVENKPEESSSALRGSGSPVDTDADPLDAISNENLSWGSIFKAFKEKKHAKKPTGMLQTEEADQMEEDQLVTITLARSLGRH